MEHRHLNPTRLTRAAIDDVIARGQRKDWEDLRQAILADKTLVEKIRAVCQPRLEDPYAQRYYFWMHYVNERFA